MKMILKSYFVRIFEKKLINKVEYYYNRYAKN